MQAQGTSRSAGRRLGATVAIMILVSTPSDAPAQINNPAYADYVLVSRFGEICTMCEAIVLCETCVAATQRDG